MPIDFVLRFSENISPEINKVAESERTLAQATNVATNAIDGQRLAFVYQIQVVRALHRGLSGSIRSMSILGLISEQTAAKLMKVDAVVMLIASSFQLLRGAREILSKLVGVEAQLAAVETYRSILRNPAMLGVAMAAVGAASGVAGYLMGSSRSKSATTEVVQNITFSGYAQSDQRSMAGHALEIWGG